MQICVIQSPQPKCIKEVEYQVDKLFQLLNTRILKVFAEIRVSLFKPRSYAL